MTEPINETQPHSVLVVGAHGVIGRPTAELFAAKPAWKTTTAARRGPVEDLEGGDGAAPEHVSVDLLDADAAKEAFAKLSHITHVVYAAIILVVCFVGARHKSRLLQLRGVLAWLQSCNTFEGEREARSAI